MKHETNVVSLVKDDERYIFLFDDASKSECLRTLGRFASNQELSFSWYDAAVLSNKIRQLTADKPQSLPMAPRLSKQNPTVEHWRVPRCRSRRTSRD